MFRLLTVTCLAISLLAFLGGTSRAELWVGAASADITPNEPVALDGQFRLRIAKNAETPITANVIVMESREGDLTRDLAIMVSCDLVYIPADVLTLVREETRKRLPDLDTRKVFLNGTHTHTAPVQIPDKYLIPKEGVMQVDQYVAFLARQVADAIAEAYNARTPGSVSWGLSHAVVAQNRRVVYRDGSARMYGPTSGSSFLGLEGYEDHDIGTLFFWNADGQLIAMAVNVSCPSQEVESRSALNADFWHPVREAIHSQYGEDVCVLGWTGASGDQSPHIQYREPAEERMRRLRGLTRLEEISRRVVRAVNDAYEVVKDDRHADIRLTHRVETLRLPMRLVTEAEHSEAKAAYDRAAAKIANNPEAADQEYRRMRWYEVTIDRFKQQQIDPAPTYEMELHVLRIGDVVVCTNPFELFTEFGIRIKGRSKAVQTFLIQLTGPGTYVPTEKAVRGGHYSAIVHSSLVGPEGGQMLVDRTVELIDQMWKD